MNSIPKILLGFAVVASFAAGCSTEPKTPEARSDLRGDASKTMDQMSSADPTLRNFLDRADGYAVFPHVGKGGAVVGGGYGRGVVYEQGQPIGYADITQLSAGAQLGGQEYSEIIVFENAAALNKFRAGNFSLGAGASAVVLKSGAGREGRFQDGVAVFVRPKAGAMAEATVSGQQFSYKSLEKAGDR
jgi:lipid-binding SYLF domain-containing protein